MQCRKCNEEKGQDEFLNRKDTQEIRPVCKSCIKAYNKKYYLDNCEKIKAKTKAYAQSPEGKKIQNKLKIKWSKENKDKVKATMKTSSKKYRIKNADKVRFWNNSRRCSRLLATPKWLTKTHEDEIKHFYWAADYLWRLTGTKMHVDHIVPLKGKNISGLHVPWNLQILTSSENIVKGNRHE